MTLMRWTPARELPALPSEVLGIQKEINRMFDSFFRGPEDDGLQTTSWNPLVDVTENDHAYLLNVELPGVSRNDVKIVVQDNQLTIRGEKKQEKESKNSNYHRVERSYGSFQRTFTLPSTVKAEKIEANYNDGVLSITVPKAEEARAKEIEVKVK
ncbi:MAG: Hsp20/alpha crystallin family protein [Bacteroidetes bacterium]|nr:Hsp20/alpha crystallin family protein [Bacteroidota bacterium]